MMRPEPTCPVCGDTDIWEVPPPYGWRPHVGASSYPQYWRCVCESLFVVDLDGVDVLVDTQNMPACPCGRSEHVVPLFMEDAYYCRSCMYSWRSSYAPHLQYTTRLEDGQYLPVPVPPSE